MFIIQPILEKINAMTILGISTRTQNCDEMHITTAKIPELWRQFHMSDLGVNATPYGVYSDYTSDVNGFYTVTAGICNDNKLTQFESIQIIGGNYLVFRGLGPMPITVIETWQQIWNFFAKTKQYHRCYQTDFEVYLGPEEIAIHIGVSIDIK